MWTMNVSRTLTLALSFCSGLALATERPPTTPPSPYTAAKAKWQAAAVTDYQFTLKRDCACLPEQPIVVVVRHGRIERAFYSMSKVEVDAKRASSLETLSSLFSVMDKAYAGAAAEVKFKANAQFGYLEYLYIDFNARVADEELIYHVSGFRAEDRAKALSD